MQNDSIGTTSNVVIIATNRIANEIFYFPFNEKIHKKLKFPYTNITFLLSLQKYV